ncbi:hypothetical protein ES703_117403 [subsurface metagenome]
MVWKDRFRSAASQWAQPNTGRIGAGAARRALQYNPERVYTFVTWNPPNNKPLTIEMRAPETHPVISSAGQKLFQVTLRRIFDKVKRFGWDVSPKLTEPSEFWLRTVSKHLITDNDKIYWTLNECGPFEFLPGRGIPLAGRKEKLRFESGFELIYELCRSELMATPRSHRYKDIYTRVLWLIMNKGVPAQEGHNIWWSYKADEYFQWSTVPPFPEV